MHTDKKNIAVLVSGGGTNLQALIDAEKSGIIKSGKIKLVISNKDGAFALERAKKAEIDTYTVLKKNFSSHAEFESEIIRILDENEIDLIVLAGFMSILSENFFIGEKVLKVLMKAIGITNSTKMDSKSYYVKYFIDEHEKEYNDYFYK